MQVPDQDCIPKVEINRLVMESLGPTRLLTEYVTLAELGLASFPLTTSLKVRKSDLREAVQKHLAGRKPEEHLKATCDAGLGAVGTTETLLSSLLGKLIGQPEHSVARDQPLVSILDSINILRLQVSIQRATSKNITIGKLLGDVTLNTLATQLDSTPTADFPIAQSRLRQGPPAATDMVHTHDDLRCASRTRTKAELLLAKHGMSWEDVEDIFPFPSLSKPSFEGIRPMAFSIRLTFVTMSVPPSLLRIALESTLERWPIFRSLAMTVDNTVLFVIPRANNATSQASVVELPEVESLEQLRGLRFPKQGDNSVHPGDEGPLARFAISRIKDTDSTGIMMLVHHVTFDAISLQAFKRDLEANIRAEQMSEPCTTYKLFADIFYQHCSSIPAQTSVGYHVNRLRGIGRLRESIWPPQRCPGWFIGDDTGYHIPPALQDPLLEERRQVDDGHECTRVLEIERTADLVDLAKLRSKHSISAPVLFKSALAILNSRLSGSAEVLFSNTQAGRQWPFLDESVSNYLPNPLTIAGNTLGMVMNRINVDAEASVGELLVHLEQEQHLLTRHAHAPSAAISAQLSPVDAAAYHAGHRQLLNWNPNSGNDAAMQGKPGKTGLELVQVEAFTDVMLEWHCSTWGSRAVVITMWDGAQFGRAVVETWANKFMVALDLVARTANWNKKLGELDLSASSVEQA